MYKNLSFAVIAGGKSSRFGSNKLLFELNGKRFIDYSLELAQNFSTEIMIVGDLNYPEDLNRFKICKDVYKSKGPLSALHSALLNSKKKYVALIPGDTPFLRKEIYEQLYSEIDGNMPVVALSDKGIEPLVSIWPKIFAQLIEDKLKKNELSIKELLDSLNYVSVKFDGNLQDCFRNINKPGELTDLKIFEN